MPCLDSQKTRRQSRILQSDFVMTPSTFVALPIISEFDGLTSPLAWKPKQSTLTNVHWPRLAPAILRKKIYVPRTSQPHVLPEQFSRDFIMIIAITKVTLVHDDYNDADETSNTDDSLRWPSYI